MKIIGFDYDGTIINIEPEKARAFGELLFKEWKINAREAEEFWIKTGGTSRRYKFDYFYEKKSGYKLDDTLYTEIEKKYSIILKTKFYPKVGVLPFAEELLEFACSKFDYVFVSSGVTHEEINYLVELNGLKKYFDEVLGTNDVYISKQDHLKKIVKAENPDTKIYIGDGLEDMKIAKKFDFVTIGIPTNHKKEELENAGADFVVDLKDCIKVLNQYL